MRAWPSCTRTVPSRERIAVRPLERLCSVPSTKLAMSSSVSTLESASIWRLIAGTSTPSTAPSTDGKRDAAGEALHHLAGRLPAQGEISVDLGAAGDRIDACNLAQHGTQFRIGEPECRLPRRHRPAGKAAVGFQRPVEKPAGERTQRQRPLGYGQIDVGLFDAVGAEKEGLGVERECSGEPIEDREVDRFVGPARRLRCRALGAGARKVDTYRWCPAGLRLARRGKAAAQPCEVEHTAMKVGAEPWRLLIQAEEDPAGQRAVADHGVDVGEACHRPVPGNLPGEAQRAEGNIRRRRRPPGFRPVPRRCG